LCCLTLSKEEQDVSEITSERVFALLPTSLPERSSVGKIGGLCKGGELRLEMFGFPGLPCCIPKAVLCRKIFWRARMEVKVSRKISLWAWPGLPRQQKGSREMQSVT